ncbi:MAG: hypothetical protein LAP85_26815 [Acidobacteriia bacterium]|nr:hypothetical protein [Terriglobia bacterium]
MLYPCDPAFPQTFSGQHHGWFRLKQFWKAGQAGGELGGVGQLDELFIHPVRRCLVQRQGSKHGSGGIERRGTALGQQ